MVGPTPEARDATYSLPHSTLSSRKFFPCPNGKQGKEDAQQAGGKDPGPIVYKPHGQGKSAFSIWSLD